MSRGKQYLDKEDSGDQWRKIEKIKKEKRSVRGRIVDDWFLEDSEFDKTASKMRRGRVIEVQKRNVFVAEEDEQGLPVTSDLWLCSVAKRHFQRAHKERNFVVVGDRILFEPDVDLKLDEHGDPSDTDLPRGVIQHAFPRKNKISRRDPLHPAWEHIMLANIDLIGVVASVLNPEVRWGLIDRFLVQAELEEVPVVIILNKCDLLSDPKIAHKEFLETYKERVATYRNIGYDVVEICALHPKKTLPAVKHLRSLFKGKLVGFAGHSGVGKSSIINLMKPEFEQIVDEDPEIFYKGRHTTTYNSLLQLGIGGYAIDTPGVRSFDIPGQSPSTLSFCFPEFRDLKCKYKECAHDLESEADCGVKQALKQGKITESRYRSYIGILKGTSLREGTGDATDALMIADLKAREQKRDEEEGE